MANDTYTLTISDVGVSIPATNSVSSTILQDNAVIEAKILNNEVKLPKLAQVGAHTILGNGTDNTANITALATTGTGNVVRAGSPTLTTPNLGQPTYIDLTYATGLTVSAISSGVLTVTNGGTGVATLAAGLVTSTGGTNPFSRVNAPTGAVVGTTDTQTLTNKTLSSPILTSPTLSSAALGTPVSGVLTNCTPPTINLATGVGTSILPIANGGTNAATASAARTSLGVPTILSGSVAAASFSSYVATVSSLTNVTTSSKAFVQGTGAESETFKAVCTAGTLTITSSASTPVGAVNYLIIV